MELFVESPEKSLDFYRRVLGFEVQGSPSTEYTMLKNGDAVIAINSRGVLSTDHPLRIDTGQRAGLGVEIVLKVADVEDAYRAAKESGWPLSDLALQPPRLSVQWPTVFIDSYCCARTVAATSSSVRPRWCLVSLVSLAVV
jgi:catechol 2,3-dioxygenase-like lactoylglutathione lyase family enzyme